MHEGPVFEVVSRAIEVAGVAIIVVGIVIAWAQFAQHVVAHRRDSYGQLRRALGRSLLLGLELLVAADIVATVALEPTFQSLGVLAILVVIRTFLSWALELETEGRWPWQKHAERSGPGEWISAGDAAARSS
ncbi:DUF1622 domain-containing protein [Sandaracinus amylolyticus]|uniref:DUF1622 domain-containing protein n=1 Tax=Sandaracinus amylolyticus TaxID=927083 RepID=UPI001F2B3B8C|nr:DUF1622 domain-containing protein [Sandaracinus amylolyticus]UJR84595.1 Hypothetical protein I5071_66740 [Sandaracinus amylolyticus]